MTATRPAEADVSDSCPTHEYLGNSPDEEQPPWHDETQGLAHDPDHWFVTTKPRMWKVPVGNDLDGSDGFSATVRIPERMRDIGFDHFGDLDHYRGFLFVPIEKGGTAASIAVFDTDLNFIDYLDTTAISDRAAWVAINPAEQVLYTTGRGGLSAEAPLLRYRLDLAPLTDPGVPREVKADRALTLISPIFVRERDAGALEQAFGTVQGGVFSPWGDLYILNGDAETSPKDIRGGIHLLRPEGTAYFRVIADSTQKDPVPDDPGDGFFYEYHTDIRAEEPEGLDWWNLNDGRSPHPGQLHALLLDNDIDVDLGSDDDLYVKHYDVSYPCFAGLDSDDDGLTDDAEAYQYNTEPLVSDSDGDELSDGAEVNVLGTDPLDPDTDGDGVNDGAEDPDGDGLTNAEEINVHQTNPLVADTDSDDLSDGCEVKGENPTDPKLADTDGDGLADGVEDSDHDCTLDPGEIDPTNPDTDGDGLSDGFETTNGTDPLDPDTDDDGLSDGFEIANATDPLDPDTDDDGIIDGQDVEWLQAAVSALPETAFRDSGNGLLTSMLEMLDDAERAVARGDYDTARRLLQTLRQRVDGCGSSPDANDWITDCSEQEHIEELIDLLQTNLDN